MRLPHVYDYVFEDNDLLLDAKIKLAVIDRTIYNNKFEKKFIIRKIHRFGYHLFLGRQETVEAFFYEEPDGDDGIKTIITSEAQYLIPRRIGNANTSRIIMTRKNVYKIGKKDVLREVIIDCNNNPFSIEYIMEASQGFSDEGKGQKGRFYIPNKDYDVVIM